MSEPQLTVLVLEYRKPAETLMCLSSLRRHLKVPHKTVLLDNGGMSECAWGYYKQGLCDVLISKREGRGGGYGQTDLFRWCDTPFSLFVQNDQELLYDVTEEDFGRLAALLETYQCVDLNGDQSRKGIWTDRAHLIDTAGTSNTSKRFSPNAATRSPTFNPLFSRTWAESVCARLAMGFSSTSAIRNAFTSRRAPPIAPRFTRP